MVGVFSPTNMTSRSIVSFFSHSSELVRVHLPNKVFYHSTTASAPFRYKNKQNKCDYSSTWNSLFFFVKCCIHIHSFMMIWIFIYSIWNLAFRTNYFCRRIGWIQLSTHNQPQTQQFLLRSQLRHQRKRPEKTFLFTYGWNKYAIQPTYIWHVDEYKQFWRNFQEKVGYSHVNSIVKMRWQHFHRMAKITSKLSIVIYNSNQVLRRHGLVWIYVKNKLNCFLHWHF